MLVVDWQQLHQNKLIVTQKISTPKKKETQKRNMKSVPMIEELEWNITNYSCVKSEKHYATKDCVKNEMIRGKHNHKEPSIAMLEMHKQQSSIERSRSKNELT
jgi:hypothetical protein